MLFFKCLSVKKYHLLSFFIALQLLSNVHAQEPAFNLWEFEVRGVTVIEAEKIEILLDPFLGPEKSFSTVQTAAQAIEKLYRDSGYPVVTVDIPEQNVDEGRVILQVIEGRVGKVRVLESDYFLLSDIKKRIPSVAEKNILNTNQLQKELDQVNSLSGDLRVIPLLKQGENPGEVDVELKVKDKMPLHGEIEYNNYASAQTSDTRLSASLGYDNLWNKYHSFSLQMMMTPEAVGEIDVLSGTYVLPVEHGKSRLAIYAVKSNSEINVFTETAGGLLIRGDSQIAGIRYVKPINESAEFQHLVTLGMDYKDVLEAVLFTADPEKDDVLTPMDYAIYAAEYKATWRKKSFTQQLGGGVYFGVRGSVNEPLEFSDKRVRANPNFIYWKISAQNNWQLPADFMLISKLKMQLTDTPVISNEQISAGGNTSVRGYYESQEMGDRGVIGGLELSSPSYFKDAFYLSHMGASLFVDAAYLEVLFPLPDETDGPLSSRANEEIYSTGIEIGFTLVKDISVKLDMAVPLKDSCNAECGENVGDVEKGDPLTTFNVLYKF